MAATDTLARLEKPAPTAPSELSSLWHEVYTHPGVDAAVVAAAVVGAGLFCYSRGAFGLGRTSTLLIEDTPFMGKAMKQVLEDQGHNVTWLTGIKATKPFTGITADGDSVVLNLNRFKTAFVDADLGKASPLQGADVVGALRKRKVFSIGTSTIPSFNDAMLANGADTAANKGVIFTSLANNQLDLTGTLRAPALQSRLDGLGTMIGSEAGKPWKKAADAVLQKYLGLD